MLHLVEELEREAERVVHANRRALAELDALDGARRASLRLVPARDRREVVRAADPEAHVVDQRLGPAAQHDAVVEALLEPAQEQRVARLGGEDEAEPPDVELPRRLEVGDDELDMGHAHDVERRP